MKLSDILVIPKQSRYEWDLSRYHLTPRQLLARYQKEELDAQKILESHEQQQRSLRAVQRTFPSAKFISRDKLTLPLSKQAKLIIALGGDNHFQYVSHFIDKTLLAGVNSDPIRSDGALVTFTIKDLEKMTHHIEKEDFESEEWTRLEIFLNGKKLPKLAISEVFIGEFERGLMSRHRITFKKKTEMQKCSGLLISTGAGSTGWYDSACRYLFKKGNTFPKTRKVFHFLTTEPYHGRLSRFSFLHGTVAAGKELRVNALNDSHGTLTIDTLEQYTFQEGSIATIRIGIPLQVLTLK